MFDKRTFYHSKVCPWPHFQFHKDPSNFPDLKLHKRHKLSSLGLEVYYNCSNSSLQVLNWYKVDTTNFKLAHYLKADRPLGPLLQNSRINNFNSKDFQVHVCDGFHGIHSLKLKKITDCHLVVWTFLLTTVDVFIRDLSNTREPHVWCQINKWYLQEMLMLHEAMMTSEIWEKFIQIYLQQYLLIYHLWSIYELSQWKRYDRPIFGHFDLLPCWYS